MKREEQRRSLLALYFLTLSPNLVYDGKALLLQDVFIAEEIVTARNIEGNLRDTLQ